ncbi:DUF362 domain-containing protein [Desulfonatronum thioautotrophicum]|uniref:DUF362 domain-containing protein n=1 Tax=Desulfonatronum thioautotrophicum TaxID=617001 RepID=UPI0005EB3BBF|nr:DUF362 domain-containing protein [Desulfonatronum thioautotrophicum]
MPSDVFFWNLRTTRKATYEVRLRRLLKAADVPQTVRSGDLTAVKMHFGESGVTGFVPPIWVRPLVAFLRKIGAKPFLTDTNTLYVGSRGDAVSHGLLAAEHGFDPLLLQAPVIIADGVNSRNETTIPFSGKHFREVHLAGDILAADSLVTLSHFKGHELAGIGGCLKNLAMGCSTRRGKMQQHGCLAPLLHAQSCTGCGACVEVCASKALRIAPQGMIELNPELCVGCGACLHACREKCLVVDWQTDVATFVERMMEYAAAVVQSFANRRQSAPACVHISFATQITPQCDCTGYSDKPVCPDIGVLVSHDPVALDQACLDLVNAAQPLHPSHLPLDIQAGEDKFRAMHPHVPEDYGLGYAESLGLGTRTYLLREI